MVDAKDTEKNEGIYTNKMSGFIKKQVDRYYDEGVAKIPVYDQIIYDQICKCWTLCIKEVKMRFIDEKISNQKKQIKFQQNAHSRESESCLCNELQTMESAKVVASEDQVEVLTDDRRLAEMLKIKAAIAVAYAVNGSGNADIINEINNNGLYKTCM